LRKNLLSQVSRVKLDTSKLKEIDELALFMKNPDENFYKLKDIWETKKDAIPSLCPHCKYSTFYHKPFVIKK